MKTQLVRFSLLATLAIAAASAMAAPIDLSGTWTMGLVHDHVVPVALVLKHEGSKITGTLTLPQGMPNGGDLPIAGEFTDGNLTLATTDDYTGPMKMKITGKILEDGTMAGDLEVGGTEHKNKMAWTAERLKKRDKKSDK